jgi:hypothetical protein
MSELNNHCCFLGFDNIVQLSGFSGAHVALLDADTQNKRVRKAALDPGSSNRLRDQAARQMHLADLFKGVVCMPEILSYGENGGCYWYDMEYISGVDAVDYLTIGTRPKIDNLLGQIKALMEVQFLSADKNAFEIDLNLCVNKKLLEIDTATSGKHNKCLQAIVSKMPDRTVMLQPTSVHGDLTLENILVDRAGKIWLIDTIPSPFDHYWIDIAKLFQDLVGRWYLHRGRTLSIGMISTITDEIFSHVEFLDKRYLNYHTTLLALNFARILPYCKSKEDIGFVYERIDIALLNKPHF